MVYRPIKPVANAVLRALWMDPVLRMHEIAARAGCSYCTVQNRARALGLPPRTKVRDTCKLHVDDLFRAMWRAGVSGYEMARHYGVKQSTVSRAASRVGLPPRIAGDQPQLALSDFFQRILAHKMAEDRRVEVALAAGVQATAAPVDLHVMFPPSDDPFDLRGQAWRVLLLAGMTARQAADRRGKTIGSALAWARRNGLQWRAGRQDQRDADGILEVAA